MSLAYQQYLGRYSEQAAKVMVVLCAFTIPMSTTMMGVATGLLFLFWLLSGNYAAKFRRIVQSPIALWPLILFILLALGLLYTTAEPDRALETLSKYKKLLFIPIIISLMLSEKWRHAAISAFAIAMTIILLISYLKYFQILPYGSGGQEYTVFKGRITHGILMAFFFYMLVHLAVQNKTWRWLFILLALFACHNLLFLNSGRSGYVIFASLVFLLFYQCFNWRGLGVALLVLIPLAITAFYSSDEFHQRVVEAVHEVQEYQSGDYDHFGGVSYRLEYYQNTLELLKISPLFGQGTGSFTLEYKRIADQKKLMTTDNPHNEFLMIDAQLGLVGLFVFCAMLYSQWRGSRDLDQQYRYFIEGMLVTMIVGCMMNSLLLDSGEGKFYVFLTAIVFAVPIRKGLNS